MDEAVAALRRLAGTAGAIRACITVVLVAVIAGLSEIIVSDAITALATLAILATFCVWLITIFAIAFVAFFHTLPRECIAALGSFAVSHTCIAVVVVSVVAFLQVSIAVAIGVHEGQLIEETIPAFGNGAVEIALPGVVAFVALLGLAVVGIDELGITITIAAHCNLAVGVAGGGLLQTHVAIFIHVTVTVSADLIRETVVAAAIS
jgi:hypothetical protein